MKALYGGSTQPQPYGRHRCGHEAECGKEQSAAGAPNPRWCARHCAGEGASAIVWSGWGDSVHAPHETASAARRRTRPPAGIHRRDLVDHVHAVGDTREYGVAEITGL